MRALAGASAGRLLLLATALVAMPAAAQFEPSPRRVVEAVNEYRRAHESEIIRDFVDLLSMPNVALDIDDMTVNAARITELLKSRGFTTQTLQSGGAPYVYAELSNPRATETVLIYAHFDGQPVQEENWTYPPFQPTLLDAPLAAGGQPVDPAAVEGEFDPEWRIYARSAGDDKMPVIAMLHTLDALRAAGIELSVNLKLLFDGEEERGSPTAARVLRENRELFDADLLLFCDGPMHQSRRAQLVFGVRGSTTLDMTTYGANRPLHSGHYGNWAPNPVMQMAYLLTSMRDESGRILIDGYYDNVATLTELERAAIAEMPDVTESLKNELAVNTPEGNGVRIEELIMLPAFNVRGLVAGGVGNKGRNVILSTADASINLRMVPNQQPARLRELIEAHIQNEGFHIVYDDPDDETLRAHPKVIKLGWSSRDVSPGLRTPLDAPMSQRLIGLMQTIAPDLIVTPTMGGTLPLGAFESELDAPIVVLPLANHDNNQHAENENLRLQNLWDAMAVYGAVLATFGYM